MTDGAEFVANSWCHVAMKCLRVTNSFKFIHVFYEKCQNFATDCQIKLKFILKNVLWHTCQKLNTCEGMNSSKSTMRRFTN